MSQRDEKVKCTLQRVRLNAGGYDRAGSYWGIGNPLYWVEPETAGFPEQGYSFRARDRDHAKEVVRARWPKATFYN